MVTWPNLTCVPIAIVEEVGSMNRDRLAVGDRVEVTSYEYRGRHGEVVGVQSHGGMAWYLVRADAPAWLGVEKTVYKCRRGDVCREGSEQR